MLDITLTNGFRIVLPEDWEPKTEVDQSIKDTIDRYALSVDQFSQKGR